MQTLLSPSQKQKTKTVYSWDDIDSDSFIGHLQANLNKTAPTNVDNAVTDFTSVLKKAAHAAVPSKILTFKGPKRRVSCHVLQSLKQVKETYNRWKFADKPKACPLHLDNKLAKKCLRKPQRMEEVARRNCVSW